LGNQCYSSKQFICLCYFAYGHANWLSTGIIPYSLTEWHHIVVVLNNDSSQEIYLDGEFKINGSLSLIIPEPSLEFTIGKQTRSDPMHMKQMVQSMK
jgi:hypothetical protein